MPGEIRNNALGRKTLNDGTYSSQVSTGALIGLGLPEYEAKRYEGRIRRGGILLSVHCDDSEWTKKAKEILKQTGAENIAATNEAPADFAHSDRPIPDIEAIPGKEMEQLNRQSS